MAILFRPIIERGESDDVYIIEAYDGNIKIRAEVMKKMSASQVQSVLVFFYALGTILLEITQSSLAEQRQETKTLQKETLQVDGRGSE